jgi:hypothetical protein
MAETATIVDVGGRWILEWPEGLRTVEISRELLEQIVADHNERVPA